LRNLGRRRYRQGIPTVVALIDDDEIIEMLAEKMRSHWVCGASGRLLNPSDDPAIAAIEQEMVEATNLQFANEQAFTARTELKQVIADTRAILRLPRLASIMNTRDKHLAHSLETTRREKNGPVQPMKYGDETELLNASIPIVERLYCWVNGTNFSIRQSQEIDQNNAEALWTGCKFEDLH
jgi:AbiU2